MLAHLFALWLAALTLTSFPRGSTVKLPDFLSRAGTAGRHNVEVLSPRGRTLLVATDPDADEVQAIIDSDAESLSSAQEHEYRVIAIGEAGGRSEHTIRVRGRRTQDDADEHRVDPSTVTNQGQALGHMTKVIVELAKTNMHMAKDIAGMHVADVKQLERTRRKYLANMGEYDLAVKAIEREEKRADAWGHRLDGILEKGGGIVKGLLAARGKLGPGEVTNELASIKATLDKGQRAQLAQVLGTDGALELLSIDTFEKLADFLEGQITEEQGATIMMAILNDEQRTRLALQLKPIADRRDKAKREAEAAASKKPDGVDGASAANDTKQETGNG